MVKEMMGILELGGKEFGSRLLVGTGKYPSFPVMKDAIEVSGAEIVTVAVRRVNLDNPDEESLLDYLDRDKYLILPNTAGAYSVEEALRIARMARAAGFSNFIKLEVIGDPKTLYPDVAGLLEASEILVKEGFTVLPYTNDDPVMAKKLEDVGVAAVMPLAAPIGSGRGILNPLNIGFIKDAVSVPVIVDAGVGTASDAAAAMELGIDGVLMNTGIAEAEDPIMMAKAMKMAVDAGRHAYLAGRIPMKPFASASSPLQGVVK